jgi:SRSO17 transposase
MDAQQIESLQPRLRDWIASFEPCFKRKATFGHFQRYLLGLLADLRRKSVEPIALASGTAVRTLQEFLSMFRWDHQRMDRMLSHRVADLHPQGGIGVIDATGHPKRGDKTPGVQRQYCGESGKIDNCVVAQHLLFTDNDAENPFSCMLASDLYLPESWAGDMDRRREAKIPDELNYRPKWKIALEQVAAARAGGVKLNWVVFDEEYGRVPEFWFKLDSMGQMAVGEVPKDFRAWIKRPACRSGQPCNAARRVDNLVKHSPTFTGQKWKRFTVKQTTRGKLEWEYKATRVHLADSTQSPRAAYSVAVPTDRKYWLIVMRHPGTGEIKYMISNAGAGESVETMIRVLLARWHVEKWFERAKQEAGLGAFEVRTYISLIRHWLCVRIVMMFLIQQTARLREKKSVDHL